MKTVGYAVASGVSLVIFVLLIAFAYVWMFPEGGDSWDAHYFFTHPAFYVIFAMGFTGAILWQVTRSRQRGVRQVS